MELKNYDGKLAHLLTIDHVVFEGSAVHNSSEYNEHEFGMSGDALQIDSYLFFERDIESIEIIEPREPLIWENRNLYTVFLPETEFPSFEQERVILLVDPESNVHKQAVPGDCIRLIQENDEYETAYYILQEWQESDSLEAVKERYAAEEISESNSVSTPIGVGILTILE